MKTYREHYLTYVHNIQEFERNVLDKWKISKITKYVIKINQKVIRNNNIIFMKLINFTKAQTSQFTHARKSDF